MIDLLLSTLPILTFISSSILLALVTYQLINPNFRFWPPPEGQPRKKIVFMTLFRIVVYGSIIFSILYVWRIGLPVSAPAKFLAILLFACGFAIAFGATIALGWANAFGSKEGLRTDGLFRYSRNPIYIATWFGLAGWALLIPVSFAIATLMIWALIYLVAIFIEERWLAREYGEQFREYRQAVRRFF
ncbi:isoprenylcysteine carboxylmethyltransferase family protein [Aliiroseovarius sp. S1339]|uniref:methyltransferase family protein n=1 Tax=Aliiroseovarius sp. S1339 TaxID=2936990 RepID=UPI0020BE1BA8|nr:isoprenylcysteine carboxylmethyltransferase family protein [Aliiroseovarius sp. S1339]MCK8464020.1 isoprenylcysteine carboxylmethyltransferase family protein [Aliiroseovarius sp. S1339]